MKIVVADDEPLARSRLRRLLADLPEYQLVGEAANGEALVQLVEQVQPDIALVDIRMPGMDGLHAARRLSELHPPPAVIFTTAFTEHALSAFGAHAVGYLLKPIKREQLQAALLKARQANRAQLSAEARNMVSSSGYIEVRERDRHIRVPLEAVICCQAEDKYTRLIWEGGQHLIDQSLRTLETDYPQALMRVHRKVLVAPHAVLGVEKYLGGLRLILKGCALQPPVSRRLAAQVRDLLKTKHKN